MTEPVPSVSQFKSRGGIGRIVCAIRYSVAGLGAALRNEHAFRQEAILSGIATVAALILPLDALHRLLLVGVLALVLIIELMNSAIEAVVDRVSLDTHPLSKAAKDFGSAAVFLAMLLAATTWMVVLWPLVTG